MSDIVEEIRQAYATVGIRVDQPVSYGTYYRLLCAGCGQMVGNVGDRLLPGMARELVEAQFDLYAAGLLGCACGHQREQTRSAAPEPGPPPRLPGGEPNAPPANRRIPS